MLRIDSQRQREMLSDVYWQNPDEQQEAGE